MIPREFLDPNNKLRNEFFTQTQFAEYRNADFKSENMLFGFGIFSKPLIDFLPYPILIRFHVQQGIPREWFRENMIGAWRQGVVCLDDDAKAAAIYFEIEEDAVLFRLGWGGDVP